jgi:predicted NAD-dependent protein-ADP-ribosyltransferase YbiA (DUF1768 family)
VPELMTRGRKSKYFWPASAITLADMALVYAARESRSPRVAMILGSMIAQCLTSA